MSEQQRKLCQTTFHPTSHKKSIMGKRLDFALKIAHRGNTGSHRGNVKNGTEYRMPVVENAVENV